MIRCEDFPLATDISVLWWNYSFSFIFWLLYPYRSMDPIRSNLNPESFTLLFFNIGMVE